MSASAKRCPQCGKDIEEDEVLEQVDELDQLIEKEPEPAEPPQQGEAEAIFMCPNCGAFMAATARKCTQCGAVLEGEEGEAEPAAPKAPTPPVSAQPEQALEMCISCGAFAPEGTVRCPKCNALMGSTKVDKKAPLKREDLELLDMLVTTEPSLPAALSRSMPEVARRRYPSDVAICAVCGAFIKPDAARCGVCGTDMDPTTIIVPEGPEILPETVSMVDKAVSAIKSVFKIRGEPERGEILPFDETNIDVCTVCGAFMPRSAVKCPICNTKREEMPKYEELSMDMEESPATRGLIVCPKCGSFAREGEARCGKCGSDIPENVMEVVPDERDASERVENVLMKVLGVTDVKIAPPEEPKASELDICVSCGAFMVSGAKVCPMCGTGAGDDVDELFKILKPSGDDAASEIGLTSECPFCGAKIIATAGTCKECGFVFAPELEHGGAPVPDRELAELEKDLEVVDLIGEGLLGKDLPGEKKSGDDIVERKIVEEEDLSDIELVKPEPMPSERDKDRKDDVLGRQERKDSDRPERIPISTESDDIMGMLVPSNEPQPSTEEEGDELVEELDSVVVKPIDAGITQPEAVEDIEQSLEELIIEEEPQEEAESVPERIPYPAEEVEVESPQTTGTHEELTEGELEELLQMDKEDQTREEAQAEKAAAAIESARVAEQRKERAKPKAVPKPAERMDDIPPWNDPEILHPVMMTSCMTLFLYVLANLATNVSPSYLSLILGGVPLVIFAGYAISRAIYGMAGLERKSLRWVSLAMAAAGFSAATAAFPTASTYVLYSLVTAGASVGLLAAYITPKGWRKREVWALSVVSVVALSWTNRDGSWAFASQLLFASSLLFVTLTISEIIADVYQKSALEIAIARGDARYIRTDYKRAAQAYEEAIHKIARGRGAAVAAGGYDVPWYRKGSVLVLAGEYEEGLKCLNMALKINPDNPVTWVNKGNALSKLGRHPQALEAYDRAIEASPKYEIAWNNKGNSLARQGKYIEALKCYNQAIKINPKYHDVWINKGYVLAKMGKFEEAARCVSAIKSQPSLSKA